MKKILLILAIGLLCVFENSLIAQKLSVTNSKTEYDDKPRAAIYVKLEPATDDVKDAWEKYIEDRFDVKVKGKGFLTNKDVLKAEKVNIPEISDKEMDLNNKIVKGEYGTDMMVFARLGYDIYLSPEQYAEQYQAMETIVYDFLGTYLPNHYAGEIDKAKKLVANALDNKEDLEKNISKNKEDIEKAKKEIEKKTKENEKMTKELVTAKEKLTEAKATLKTKTETLDMIKSKMSVTKSD